MFGFLSKHPVGTIVLAFGLGVFALSFGIGKTQWGAESARLFPQMASIVIAVLGALYLRQEVLGQVEEPQPGAGERQLLWLAILGGIYIFAIGKFGYLLSTGAVFPIVLWIFGTRSVVALAASSIAAPMGFHILFFEILGLFSPRGAWFDLLNVLGM